MSFSAHSSKRDRLYEEILSRLIGVRYRFGERIMVKQLVLETNASRQPIGAALNALAADGFVRIIPQVGCEVVRPDRAEMADFFRMLAIIEGEIASLAAKRRTTADLRMLDAIVRKLAEEADHASPEDMLRLGQDFSEIVHRMAASGLVTPRFGSLGAMASFLLMQCSDAAPALGDFSLRLAEISELIARGEAEGSAAAIGAHVSALYFACPD